jgi:hypothetical protein
MDLRVVREALRKEPFEPFILADGRSLPIRHPEFVAIGKRRLVVIEQDDSWSILELPQIAALDQMKKAPTRRQRQKTPLTSAAGPAAPPAA